MYDKQLNKYCDKCPDLVESRRRITWGCGDVNSKVMFVGEAPGRNGCDITGIPFTQDPSGEYFQYALFCSKMEFKKVYTTNIVKCCPKHSYSADGEMRFANRTPTDQEVENCVQYLITEIDKVNPEIIFCIGKVSYDILINKTYSTKIKENIHIHYLVHPAFYLRQGKSRDYYAGYFRRKMREFGVI